MSADGCWGTELTPLFASQFYPWHHSLPGLCLERCVQGSHGGLRSFILECLESQNHQGWKSPPRSSSPAINPALPRSALTMSPGATSTDVFLTFSGIVLPPLPWSVPGHPFHEGIFPKSNLNHPCHSLRPFPLDLLCVPWQRFARGQPSPRGAQLWKRGQTNISGAADVPDPSCSSVTAGKPRTVSLGLLLQPQHGHQGFPLPVLHL